MGSGLGFYYWLLQPQIFGQHIREPTDSSTTGTIIASAGARTKKKPVDKEMRGWSPKLERQQQQDQTSSDIKLSEEEAEQQQQQDSDDEEIPPSLHEDQEEEPAQVASMTTAITTTTVFQPADIHFSCADRLYTLIDEWYVKDHRNDIMLTVTGTIRRSWYYISLEDAEKIIKHFCDIAQDEEPELRLTTLRTTSTRHRI